VSANTIRINAAKPGQVREIQLLDGTSLILRVVETTGTRCCLEIEPGDAVKRVLLDESTNGKEEE
jgi:hypothetical protein